MARSKRLTRWAPNPSSSWSQPRDDRSHALPAYSAALARRVLGLLSRSDGGVLPVPGPPVEAPLAARFIDFLQLPRGSGAGGAGARVPQKVVARRLRSGHARDRGLEIWRDVRHRPYAVDVQRAPTKTGARSRACSRR